MILILDWPTQQIGIQGFHFIDIQWEIFRKLENISNWACRDYIAKPNKRGCYRGFIAEAGENQFRSCNTHPKEFCRAAFEVQLDFQRFHDGLSLSFGFGYPAFPCCHLSVGTFVTTYGQQASAHLGLKTWDLIVSWLARASSPCLPAHLLPGSSLVQFFLFLVHRAIQCWEFISFLPEDLMKIYDIWKYISLNKL